MAIEFEALAGMLSVPGQIATEETSGFVFAEAKDFKIKPVIALLKGKGPITVKTGSVETALPEKGRGKAIVAFAKACTLD